jgi:hypothetical protein
MDAIVECCAGLDVHQASVVACVNSGPSNKRSRKEVRTFGTTLAALEDMRDWLTASGCTLRRVAPIRPARRNSAITSPLNRAGPGEQGQSVLFFRRRRISRVGRWQPRNLVDFGYGRRCQGAADAAGDRDFIARFETGNGEAALLAVRGQATDRPEGAHINDKLGINLTSV